MSKLKWHPAAKLIRASDGVAVYLPEGMTLVFLRGIEAEVLERLWGSNGPEAELAARFLAERGRLIFPVWNSVLKDLTEAGVVTGGRPAEDAPMAATLSRRYPWHRIWLSLPLPSVKFRPVLLNRIGLVGIGLAVIMTGLFFWRFEVNPMRDEFYQAGTTFWCILSCLIFLVSRNLLMAIALRSMVPGTPSFGFGLYLGVPFLVRDFRTTEILSPEEKTHFAVFGLGLDGLAIAIGGAWYLLGGGLLSWALVLIGWVAAAYHLLPYLRHEGALLLEGLYREPNINRTLVQTIAYRLLPQLPTKVKKAPMAAGGRYLILVIWSVLVFGVIVFALFYGGRTLLRHLHEFAILGVDVPGGWGVWFGLWVVGVILIVALLASAMTELSRTYLDALRHSRRIYGTAALTSESRSRLVELASKNVIFAGCHTRTIEELANRAEVRVYPPAVSMIREGEIGETFFVILDGSASVVKRGPSGAPQLIARVGRGAGLGELALLETSIRTATVLTNTVVEAVAIDSNDFFEWLQTEKVDERDVRHRIRLSQVASHSEFLALLPHKVVIDFVNRSTWLDIAEGTAVIREGEAGDALYLILDGLFDVERQGRIVARLGQGAVFGEMALLSGKPRSATVRAVSAGLVLRIPDEAFRDAMAANPSFAEAAKAMAGQRARAS